MTTPAFPCDLPSILQRINQIDPIRYGKNRNYIDGNVSYLSPYISRGVISTKQILDHLIESGFKLYEIESFVKELAWRDYFQRLWQEKDIEKDIKFPQPDVEQSELPRCIAEAQTGILGIDQSIQTLYDTGYMHNHCRMYVSSLACNIARSYWQIPARWMYYHLLDGDWASNVCSWQWVSASNSNKKYYANQENISKFTGIQQSGTFLDKSYEELERMPPPYPLKDTIEPSLKPYLPASDAIEINPDLPTFIYTYYNLDPFWNAETKGNRILLLEPSHFKAYPVSRKCIDFALDVGKNIANLTIFSGEWHELAELINPATAYYKEHPFNRHFKGNLESRSWMVPEITGYYPSFFAYWKRIEPYLKKQFTANEGSKKTAFTQ